MTPKDGANTATKPAATASNIIQVTGRLAFLQVWNAKQINGEGKPKFSCSVLLPKDDPQIKKISDVIRAVAVEKWKDKADVVLKQLKAQNRICLQSGDTKAEYEGFAGNVYISASRDEDKGRPTVVDRNKTQLTAADGKPYSGCTGTLSLQIWAQDNQYGKRINAELRGVQFVKDGDAFSGGSMPASADEFADLGEGADAEAVEGGAASEDLV